VWAHRQSGGLEEEINCLTLPGVETRLRLSLTSWRLSVSPSLSEPYIFSCIIKGWISEIISYFTSCTLIYYKIYFKKKLEHNTQDAQFIFTPLSGTAQYTSHQHLPGMYQVCAVGISPVLYEKG